MLESVRTRVAQFIAPRVRNSYDAAGGGRRLRSWLPGMAGPNSVISADLGRVRERSRDAVRNNAWISQGLANTVSNEIGCGIEPRSLAPVKDFATAANQLWEEWTKVADADGVLNFAGILALAARERRESGEMFIRLRPRPASYGLPVPLQLQCLEAELCPHDYNDVANKVRFGVEFNGIGKRTAYWMYREHPGESASVASAINTLVPVPAASVIHHYAPLRAGQLRGVPWTVQALIKTKDFDDYDDAELVRKKNRSAYTGVFTRQQYSDEEYSYDPFSGAPLTKDASGNAMMSVEPGTFISALPGEDVRFFEGDATGQGYADFCRQQLLGAAAAMGIPYEFLTGDMSKVNDRLMRVIYNEYHRIIEQSQWHLMIPQVCNRVWEAFIDAAVLIGALPAPDYANNRAAYLKVEWQPYRWPYLNPLQDVEAAGLEIKYGLQSRSGAAAERGLVAEEIDRQNSEDKKRAESLGLRYDLEADAGNATDSTEQEAGSQNDPEEQTPQQRLRNFRRVNRDRYEEWTL